MKNFKKRLIAIAALMCVALASVTSCSDNNNDDSGSSSKSSVSSFDSSGNESSADIDAAPMLTTPFQWDILEDGQDTISVGGREIDVDLPDPVTSATTTKASDENKNTEITTQIVEVKDDNGQPVTEIVTATEANGEPKTEAGGQVVTEAVPVTTIVEATQESTSANTTSAASEYVPHTKGMYAMWIDISKDENFYFNGSFIRITFKVKDTAPDGTYEIRVVPDLSSVEGVTIRTDSTLNGSVTVGGSAQNTDIPSDGFVVYADNVSAKQGEEFDVCINMKNNPGLVAMFVWFYYDSNALEIVDCQPEGEFAEQAGYKTQFNTQPEES